MRRTKVTLAALAAVGALGAFAPGAWAAPGQECDGQGTENEKATTRGYDHANLGESPQHMGSDSAAHENSGDGGMMKAQPFCM